MSQAFYPRYLNLAVVYLLERYVDELSDIITCHILIVHEILSLFKINDAIEGARKKAREFYLDNDYLQRKFKEKKVWFKTRVKNPAGSWSECLVLPIENKSKCAVMMRDVYETHKFHYKGKELVGRMMIKVRQIDELVDPFDFRYSK
jgi:hypothetical protein